MNIQHKVDDRFAKLIGIPAIGILLPNITGLIINSRYNIMFLLVQYGYFIVSIYILWHGNILVIIWIKNKMNFDKSLFYTYILVIIICNVAYAGLVAAFFLTLWTRLFPENYTNAKILVNAVLLLTFIATFITVIYENYLLNKRKLSALSKVERMSLAKTQAELTVLKSQIDPHFIFNSLNTLSYLISSNPPHAKLYNDTLAKVYQYILTNKEKDLVLLREEIEFISNYFYLLRIRFDNAIRMTIEINDLEAEDLLIPPISLQTLIENAIKHNEFDEHAPLVISVCVSSNQIVVSNKINYKSFSQPTSKIGLTNLDNRYRLITKRNISVDVNHYFTVKLPIINLYR